ncbi:hypothetical protein CBR_g884 [Chara braunii]|uniref:Formamidopyrimidine-DNA glycosylase catalytic domain-containing protein n=1 Tax=Chara braunii TaxID=69332 RepID=A0A388KCJ5_CHABU|nr:hypothetical protein CBR_g884 [Chara braunii]|eukprot:GBG67759.1 hypothetical protein CBR_g884 [Chara braunii]
MENCRGKKISEAIVEDDNLVIEGLSPNELGNGLTGRVLVAVHRKGKHLWFELDKRPWPTFHFGMTGSIKIRGVEVVRYRRSIFKQDEEWPPKFYKLILKFNDGVQLAFTDSRRFARIRLVDDPLATPPVSELGVDAFSELPPPNEFAALVSKRGVSIKSLLLDQRTLAGVGNWVADEVLCQARIHPEQVASSLTREQCDALHRSLQTVLKTAVELDADCEKFPKNWLFHYRWDKLPGKINGHPISYATVGQRTTAFVPALQKKVGTGKVIGTRGGSRSTKSEKAAIDVSVNSAEEPVEPLKLRSTTSRKRRRASEQQQDSSVEEDGSPGVETGGKRVRGTAAAASGKMEDENAETDARTTPKRATPGKTNMALRSVVKANGSPGVGTRGKRGRETAVAGSGKMDDENAETDARTRGTPGKTNMALRNARTTPAKTNMALRSATKDFLDSKEDGNPGVGTRAKRAGETGVAASRKMDDRNSETETRTTPSRGSAGKTNMALRSATKEDVNPGVGTRGKRPRETAAVSGKMDEGNAEADPATTPRVATPGKADMGSRRAAKEDGSPGVETRGKRARETEVAASGKMHNGNPQTDTRTNPSRGTPWKMNIALRSAIKEDGSPGVETRGSRRTAPVAVGKMDDGNGETDATASRTRQGKVNIALRKHSKQENQSAPPVEQKTIGKNDTTQKGTAKSKDGGGGSEEGDGKITRGKKTRAQDSGKEEEGGERTAPAVLDKNSKGNTPAKGVPNKRSNSAEQDHMVHIIIEAAKEDVNANKSARGGATPQQLRGRNPPRGVKKQSSASQEESTPGSREVKAGSNGVQKQTHAREGKVPIPEIKNGVENSIGKHSRTRARFQRKGTHTSQKQRQDVKEKGTGRRPLTKEINKIGGDADGVSDEGRRRSARIGTKKA